MDVQHEIWKVIFKFRNHFAPLDDPRKILDIGCGTGRWAIEMGTLVAFASSMERHANNGRLRVPQRVGASPSDCFAELLANTH